MSLAQVGSRGDRFEPDGRRALSPGDEAPGLQCVYLQGGQDSKGQRGKRREAVGGTRRTSAPGTQHAQGTHTSYLGLPCRPCPSRGHVSAARRDLPQRHVSDRGHVAAALTGLRVTGSFLVLVLPPLSLLHLPPAPWRRRRRKRGGFSQTARTTPVEMPPRSPKPRGRSRPSATPVAWRTGFWCCC